MICLTTTLTRLLAAQLAFLLVWQTCQLRSLLRTPFASTTIYPYLHQFGLVSFKAFTTCKESHSRIMHCIPKSLLNSTAHKVAYASTMIETYKKQIVWLLDAITWYPQSQIIIPIPIRLFKESMAASQFTLYVPGGKDCHFTRTTVSLGYDDNPSTTFALLYSLKEEATSWIRLFGWEKIPPWNHSIFS